MTQITALQFIQDTLSTVALVDMCTPGARSQL